LQNVINLCGTTDLRQLVRLVYHAQDVLSPVTLLMHLAPAVETRPGMPRNRPCVVVAGGRVPISTASTARAMAFLARDRNDVLQMRLQIP
jgi:Glycosyltransferase family 9 (heptosyltransferase)